MIEHEERVVYEDDKIVRKVKVTIVKGLTPSQRKEFYGEPWEEQK